VENSHSEKYVMISSIMIASLSYNQPTSQEKETISSDLA
jgi:hypothetical protein